MRIHTHARAHTGTRGQTHARACTACTNGDPYFGRFSININMQLYIECGNDMEGTSEWNISVAMSVAQDHYMPNVCACTRARASAVPLCTTAVPHRTAAEHIRLRWRAPGRKRRTHTWYKLETRAVFHAPMFALNADADWNACAPKPHAVHADGQGLARFRVSGFRPSPQHEPANPCAHSRSIPIAHWCMHT